MKKRKKGLKQLLKDRGYNTGKQKKVKKQPKVRGQLIPPNKVENPTKGGIYDRKEIQRQLRELTRYDDNGEEY